jgi:DNA repair exonuclease SbcCD ATPase subunit
MNIDIYKEFLVERKTNRRLLKKQKTSVLDTIYELKKSIGDLETSRDIFISSAILSQKTIKEAIEELVTKSLRATFGDNYSFELESKISRNKPEIEFFVVEDGNRRRLRDGFGGGVADVVAFSLRIILWAMRTPRSNSTIAVDEPLKYVDKNRLSLFGDILSRLSDMMGIQFIIVSHEAGVVDAANKSFFVSKTNKISTVEEVDTCQDLYATLVEEK